MTDPPSFSCATGINGNTASNVPLSLQTIATDALFFSRALEAATEVRIMDIQGRLVFGRTIATGNALALPALPAARYTVQVIEPNTGTTVLPMLIL